MRSITPRLLFASTHQEPVSSHVTAAGSCAQVTRPETTPRGTPSGKSGSNQEEPMLLAAGIERANSRRVISTLSDLPHTKVELTRLPSWRAKPVLLVRTVRSWIVGVMNCRLLDLDLTDTLYQWRSIEPAGTCGFLVNQHAVTSPCSQLDLLVRRERIPALCQNEQSTRQRRISSTRARSSL